MDNEKLSFKEKLGYALTAMGSDMTTQTTGSFLQLFYTSVVGIPIALASLVISLSAIWDAINDPLIASWVDNHRFKNGERMRPVLAWSCVPFALCFIMIFTTINASLPAKIAYSFGWYFIYMVPRTFYYLPVFTLRQVASARLEDRLALNEYVSYGQAFGSSLPTLILWPIIYAVAGVTEVNGVEEMVNPQRGYLVAAVIIAATVVFCSLFNYFTTKERVITDNPKTPIIMAIKLLVKDRNFILNLIIFFFYGMCVSLTTGYAAYYCNYVLLNHSLVTPISAMLIVGTLLATPFDKKLYSMWGRNKSMVAGSLILALGALVFTALARKTAVAAFFFTFCVGVGTAITIIVIGINRADVTDVLEWKEGRRMDGMVSNVTSLIKKLAHALITLLLGIVLQVSGFIEKTDANPYPMQPESAKMAIVIIMGAGVLISALLMAYFSSKVTLDREIEKCKAAE